MHRFHLELLSFLPTIGLIRSEAGPRMDTNALSQDISRILFIRLKGVRLLSCLGSWNEFLRRFRLSKWTLTPLIWRHRARFLARLDRLAAADLVLLIWVSAFHLL